MACLKENRLSGGELGAIHHLGPGRRKEVAKRPRWETEAELVEN